MSRPYQLNLPRILEEKSRLLAALNGFFWGDRGNPTQFWIALTQFKYLLVPNKEEWGEQMSDRIWQILAQVQDCQRSQQPFTLAYRHANGRIKSYSVHYAEVVTRERRLYLDAWTVEPDDRQHPDLAHNRSFRLSRIEGVKEPTTGEWQEGLDTLMVSFEIYSGLIDAYDGKPDDNLSYIGDRVYVCRNITSTFWFFREILPYGKDCVLLEPVELRQKLADEINQMNKIYEQ